MAKKQSFGEKVARHKSTARTMAKIVVTERKANGQFRFKEKIVPAERVQDELKAARP